MKVLPKSLLCYRYYRRQTNTITMPSPVLTPANAAASEHPVTPDCTYVLVLNWNGWQVTLRCLESLLRMQMPTATRILVWDNGSNDDSAQRIAAWGRGELAADTRVPTALRPYVQPPIAMPQRCELLDERWQICPDAPLVVVRGSRNLGYAGGNNAAMRWALAQADCARLWILNNDVIVDQTCLQALHDAHRHDRYDRPLGTPIYDFDHPEQVQAWAGQRLGRGWLLAPRHAREGERLDYLIGASLFVSRQRAEQLGFFNEDYFLNAEDLEYTYGYARQFRAAHRGEEPFLVCGRIWHQESATQGRSFERQAYYFTRNLVYAAWRIGFAHGVTTFAYGCLRVVWNGLRGRSNVARGIARGLWHTLRGITGPLST